MPARSPLIEHYLPIDEISVEAVREGGAMAGHPPVNQLHFWWVRRPLITSRAAILASVLDGDTDYDQFVTLIGTSRQIVQDRRNMDDAKSKSEWSDFMFSGNRAFKSLS